MAVDSEILASYQEVRVFSYPCLHFNCACVITLHYMEFNKVSWKLFRNCFIGDTF